MACMVGMDEARLDLIAQLCTRVGTIMEDASVVALMVGGGEEGDLHDALDHLERASARITGLLSATRALMPD